MRIRRTRERNSKEGNKIFFFLNSKTKQEKTAKSFAGKGDKHSTRSLNLSLLGIRGLSLPDGVWKCAEMSVAERPIQPTGWSGEARQGAGWT